MVKSLKQPDDICGGDANARIPHRQLHTTISERCANVDFSLIGVFHRVGQIVKQALQEQPAISEQGQELWW